MVDEQWVHRLVGVLHKIPGWLWRLFLSLGLGGTVFATVVPWAQAQRGYASFGGEHVLVLAVVVLPLLIFRR